MLADLVGPEKRTRAYGLLRITMNLGNAIGPAIGGFIAQRSYLALFILNSVASLIYSGIILLGTYETRPEVQDQQASAGVPQRGWWDVALDRPFMVFAAICVSITLMHSQITTTFPVYMIRNVLRWIQDLGGAEAMQARNQEKADIIYGMIDENPDFFHCPVEKESRSIMNPVFRLPSEELEKTFIAEAAAAGMVGIKGHRSVGGIRTSIYNAMEPADVQRFADFAQAFAKG
jgi:hypothetical protein